LSNIFYLNRKRDQNNLSTAESKVYGTPTAWLTWPTNKELTQSIEDGNIPTSITWTRRSFWLKRYLCDYLWGNGDDVIFVIVMMTALLSIMLPLITIILWTTTSMTTGVVMMRCPSYIDDEVYKNFNDYSNNKFIIKRNILIIMASGLL
jgi:hypothetical protein